MFASEDRLLLFLDIGVREAHPVLGEVGHLVAGHDGRGVEQAAVVCRRGFLADTEGLLSEGKRKVCFSCCKKAVAFTL